MVPNGASVFCFMLWERCRIDNIQKCFDRIGNGILFGGIPEIIRFIVQYQPRDFFFLNSVAERVKIFDQAAQVFERNRLLIRPRLVLRARGHAVKTRFGRGLDKNVRVRRRVRKRAFDDAAQGFVKIVFGARDDAFCQHMLTIDMAIGRRAGVNEIMRVGAIRRRVAPDANVIIEIAHRIGERPTLRVLKVPFEKGILVETFQNGGAVWNFARQKTGQGTFAGSDIAHNANSTKRIESRHADAEQKQRLSVGIAAAVGYTRRRVKRVRRHGF